MFLLNPVFVVGYNNKPSTIFYFSLSRLLVKIVAISLAYAKFLHGRGYFVNSFFVLYTIMIIQW